MKKENIEPIDYITAVSIIMLAKVVPKIDKIGDNISNMVSHDEVSNTIIIDVNLVSLTINELIRIKYYVDQLIIDGKTVERKMKNERKNN